VLFAPYVSHGGVIIFDDYQDREFPGIEAAVLDFCEIDRPRRFVPFFSGANKIYCCEPPMAAKYQKIMLSFPFISSQARYVKVKDFWILIGFSKLPVDPSVILSKIDSNSSFDYDPCVLEDVSAVAKTTSQLMMM